MSGRQEWGWVDIEIGREATSVIVRLSMMSLVGTQSSGNIRLD